MSFIFESFDSSLYKSACMKFGGNDFCKRPRDRPSISWKIMCKINKP